MIKPASLPISAGRLKSFVERIEKLEEERKAIGGDIRDVYSEAKGVGYDVKTMRKVVQLRKMDAADRDEQEALLDTYWHALETVDRITARAAAGESTRQIAAAENVSKSTAARVSQKARGNPSSAKMGQPAEITPPNEIGAEASEPEHGNDSTCLSGRVSKSDEISNVAPQACVDGPSVSRSAEPIVPRRTTPQADEVSPLSVTPVPDGGVGAGTISSPKAPDASSTVTARAPESCGGGGVEALRRENPAPHGQAPSVGAGTITDLSCQASWRDGECLLPDISCPNPTPGDPSNCPRERACPRRDEQEAPAARGRLDPDEIEMALRHANRMDATPPLEPTTLYQRITGSFLPAAPQLSPPGSAHEGEDGGVPSGRVSTADERQTLAAREESAGAKVAIYSPTGATPRDACAFHGVSADRQPFDVSGQMSPVTPAREPADEEPTTVSLGAVAEPSSAPRVAPNDIWDEVGPIPDGFKGPAPRKSAPQPDEREKAAAQ